MFESAKAKAAAKAREQAAKAAKASGRGSVKVAKKLAKAGTKDKSWGGSFGKNENMTRGELNPGVARRKRCRNYSCVGGKVLSAKGEMDCPSCKPR